MRSNEALWQTTVGEDLNGSTLGLLGLGRLGSRVAAVGLAFEMSVIAMGAEIAGEGTLGVDSPIMGETGADADAEPEAETSKEGTDKVAGGPKDGDVDET